jgi:hypothetical protein
VVLVERLVLVEYLWQMPVCMEVQVLPMPVDRTGMVQLLAALEVVELVARVQHAHRFVCATQPTSR